MLETPKKKKKKKKKKTILFQCDCSLNNKGKHFSVIIIVVSFVSTFQCDYKLWFQCE